MNTDNTRRQMVAQQIRTWDVFDPAILDACGAVPREHYVPDGLARAAYADTEIPLAHGRCILRPNIVGRMLQAVEVQPGEQVLVVGCDNGYLAACLARLARSVHCVDIFPDLVEAARERLAANAVDNVTLACVESDSLLPGDRFDAIVVGGSVPTLDAAMLDALQPGGRLFAVVGESTPMQAMLARRSADGDAETSVLFETGIPPLLQGARRPSFTF